MLSISYEIPLRETASTEWYHRQLEHSVYVHTQVQQMQQSKVSMAYVRLTIYSAVLT
jgi:hypothetical protein